MACFPAVGSSCIHDGENQAEVPRPSVHCNPRQLVINSGKSIPQSVYHLFQLRDDVRIVVVAGVPQAWAVHERSCARDKLSMYDLDAAVPLRVSENKYTGRGTTDTGERLFHTVHLP